MSDALVCPSCREPFQSQPVDVTPRSLECGHAVCGVCADAAVKGRLTGCLVCGLPGTKYVLNPGIASYSEELVASGSPLAQGVCADCQALELDPQPLVAVCAGCKGRDKPLCADHVGIHERLGHAGLSLLHGRALNLCRVHPGIPLTRYCFTEGVAVCGECVINSHRGHDAPLLDSAAAVLAGKVTALAEVLTDGLTKIAPAPDAVVAAKAQLLSTVEASFSAYDAAVDGLIARVNAHRKEWKDMVTAECAMRVKALDSQSSEVSATIEQLRAGLSMCASSVGSGDPLVLARAQDTCKLLSKLAVPFGGPRASPSLQLAVNPRAVDAMLARMSWVRTPTPCLEKCQLGGPGMLGCITGAPTDSWFPEQNVLTLSLFDDNGYVCQDVNVGEVDVQVHGATAEDALSGGGDGAPVGGGGGGGLVGCLVTIEPTGPGQFKLMYSVTPSAASPLSAVMLHVTVCGVPVPPSPLAVPNVSKRGCRLFPGSTVLRNYPDDRMDSFADLLTSWLPEDRVGIGALLYRGSRDGFTPTAFHTRCDKRGPTLVLYRCTKGYAFGGYADIPFDSESTNRPSFKSFLFTVVNPHKDPVTRFKLRAPFSQAGVYSNRTQGPGFGGHSGDISLPSEGGRTTGLFTHTANTKNFPYMYLSEPGSTAMTGSSAFTGNPSFVLAEVEVWEVPGVPPTAASTTTAAAPVPPK